MLIISSPNNDSQMFVTVMPSPGLRPFETVNVILYYILSIPQAESTAPHVTFWPLHLRWKREFKTVWFPTSARGIIKASCLILKRLSWQRMAEICCERGPSVITPCRLLDWSNTHSDTCASPWWGFTCLSFQSDLLTSLYTNEAGVSQRAALHVTVMRCATKAELFSTSSETAPE